MPEQEFNATVIYRHDPTDSVSIVRVAPDSGTIPDFEPGQVATLGLPAKKPTGRRKLVCRLYSIASAPSQQSYLEFFINLVPKGAFTPKLWIVEQGGRLWLGPKITGKFTLLDVPPDKDLLLISTGTGIGPFVSMLRHYRRQSQWRRMVLINGSRYAAELGYRQELQAANREDPTVFYIPTVSREPPDSDWPGERGRVQRILEPRRYERLVGAPLKPEDCYAFLCGNPEMIADVRALLEARGFVLNTKETPGNLFVEEYWFTNGK